MSKTQGFTLIEILIYVAITTGLVTVAILAAYQMIDARDRVRQQRELAENQKLLEQKIYWVLQSVNIVNVPAAGATSTSLSVDKIGYGSNPVTLDVVSGVARITKGFTAPQPITSDSYVEVRDLAFHQFDFSGQLAIRISGSLFNAYASTAVDIDTTIIVK